MKNLPYVAARAGVEATTLRLRVIDLTNAPPRPTGVHTCTHTGIEYIQADRQSDVHALVQADIHA